MPATVTEKIPDAEDHPIAVNSKVTGKPDVVGGVPQSIAKDEVASLSSAAE